MSDGSCDDGGPGSEYMESSGKYGYCEPGADCGDRWLIWNPDTNYVDFCDNVKACAQSFGSLGKAPPPPPSAPGRRLQETFSNAASLRASRMTVLFDSATFDVKSVFDIFELELNGT